MKDSKLVGCSLCDWWTSLWIGFLLLFILLSPSGTFLCSLFSGAVQIIRNHTEAGPARQDQLQPGCLAFGGRKQGHSTFEHVDLFALFPGVPETGVSPVQFVQRMHFLSPTRVREGSLSGLTEGWGVRSSVTRSHFLTACLSNRVSCPTWLSFYSLFF